MEGATRVEFPPEHAEEILAGLPVASAVFALRGDPGSEPYVSQTADLRRRLTRLLGAPAEQSKRLNLRERCRAIEYRLTGSDFESRLVLYRTLREEFPNNYRDRLKLRFAPFIKLNLENLYPRAYVTRRISKLPAKSRSRYYGPFPSHAAAEKFLNGGLDFFKMRRCDFDLNPDPAFPGCVYSEMKMCLAPCFRGCSDDEYDREVSRVQAFLDSRGDSLLRDLSAERERASAEMQFETAAAIHARWEKVKALLGAVSLPEIVRPLEQLNAVIVQRSIERETVELFRVHQGFISLPVRFTIKPVAGQEHVTPPSMEGRVAAAFEAAQVGSAQTAVELNEHIALLKRWYYRSKRHGEIFFADLSAELPLRRIVRGIGRVLKGEDPELGESEAAHRAYWLARTREQN